MMEQYHRMRRSLPEDVLLFYRLGDFYELFFEDAKVASGILNVALTKRHDVPMCGVPYHAAEAYIAKLVKSGKRVAIAEQTSVPQPGKLVEREIAQIISAGTVADMNLLDDRRNNYLAAVFLERKSYGLACVDHTTGEFSLAEFANRAALDDELERLAPSELLVSDEQLSEFGRLRGAQAHDSYAFLPATARTELCDHFKVKSLDGYGCEGLEAAIGAAGAVMHYLRHQLRRQVDHLRRITVRRSAGLVLVDAASQRNLDLVESRSGAKHTLLAALDKTSTPMGARLLRTWILHPLDDMQQLLARQEFIAGLLAEPFLLSQIQSALKGIRDVERTTARLSQNAGNGRDLNSLANSLEKLPQLRSDIAALGLAPDSLGLSLESKFGDFTEMVALLRRAIVDEPPANLRDGNLIRDGYCPALDDLRAASRDGKRWIAELQESERVRTGIDSLKVKFNNVFGYFIEISKARLDKVPDDYQRKQTMANAERYITPELKEVEGKVLGAEERAKQLEHDEFVNLRAEVCKQVDALQRTAGALAELDVLCGLAELAQLQQYCRPELSDGGELVLLDARHPVLDQTLVDEKFVPNDTRMDPENSRLQILTGPNMAGKSTYIRQVALITLMAQIGSFVPASSARIGLVDRIFCRVGASDDLARGQSTFMVEMNETSLIVNNASERSLVILDEIGRGTATFDGLSIAWSVAEFLHDEIRCRALFATHYHELCDLASNRDAVANFNVAVREWNEEIIFLRKIIEGPADKSYGIQVARLAGLPPKILNRAKAILSHLEMNAGRPGGTQAPKKKRPSKVEDNPMPQSDRAQMDLFD